MIQDLKVQIKHAAAALEIAQSGMDDVNKLIAETVATIEQRHADTISAYTEASDRLRTLTEQLRIEAIEQYAITGEKKIDDEVSVRVTVGLDYAQNDAVSWAKTNAPVMVVESVDKKLFDAFAKANELSFVTKTEKVSAVLAASVTRAD
jgi:hypothetical protein